MINTEIFYFDVDGTLLDNEAQHISDETIEALHTLKAKGYKIAVCTGRTLGGIIEPGIKALADWDLYVLANGSQILDKDLQVLKEINCKPDFVKAVIEAYDGPIILEGNELYITEALSEPMADFMKSGNILEPPIIEYTDESIQKIIIEHPDKIEGGMNHPLFKDYQYNINTHNLYEIFPKAAGKHTGIEVGNEHFQLEKSTFFGDGTNDLTALEYASIGVAMDNAIESVKEKADLIADSVSKNGVYKILKEHKVI